MRQRIDFFAPPFSGHLHPILAMARALNSHYEVRVVSSKGAQNAIKAAGLQGLALSSIDDQQLLSIVNPPYAVGSNPIRLHRQFSNVLLILQRVYGELEVLYQHEKPDLFIIDFTLPVAGSLASKKNIPWWTSLPSPCVLESLEGPPAYLGGLKDAINPYQRIRNNIARILVKLFKTLVFYFYRKEISKVGLDALYRKDGSEVIYSQAKILCLGMQQLEFHKKWPSSAQFIGPMLYTPEIKCFEPEFIESKTYVLVTLGTHLHWSKDTIASNIVALAKKMPELIFHFSDGNSKLSTDSDNSIGNFKRFDYIDYDKHLQQYTYVIHHGGAGIMYQCLSNAIPAIVYPIDYDQFDHAARLEHAGVAIWVKSLSRLEWAFQQLIGSVSVKDRCKQYSEKIDAEKSKEKLVELVKSYFKKDG